MEQSTNEGKDMKEIPMLEKFAAQSLVEQDGELIFSKEKFAELLEKEFEAKHFSAGYIAGKSDGIIETVRECGVALSPMLRDMISRGQAVDIINKHFGVEE